MSAARTSLTAAVAFTCTAAAFAASTRGGPVKLLIDTDAGFDVDDVGAICMATLCRTTARLTIGKTVILLTPPIPIEAPNKGTLTWGCQQMTVSPTATLGEAEIVAVGHTNGFDLGIGGVSTLMHYYGRDDVPLGAYNGPWARNPHCPGAKGGADKYLTDLTKHYPSPVKNLTGVPTAVATYRKALAGQPDGSVHIDAIGITTNIRDLVLSKPDAASSLNGHDLIAAKVNVIV